MSGNGRRAIGRVVANARVEATAVTARAERPLGVVVALFALYFIWGSTYLAIRFALDGFRRSSHVGSPMGERKAAIPSALRKTRGIGSCVVANAFVLVRPDRRLPQIDLVSVRVDDASLPVRRRTGSLPGSKRADRSRWSSARNRSLACRSFRTSGRRRAIPAGLLLRMRLLETYAPPGRAQTTLRDSRSQTASTGGDEPSGR
jgi:hypothetical protein